MEIEASLALDTQLSAECGIELNPTNLASFRISPFISGTFQGFEEEFKHLYTEVFPKLDQLCREKGLRFMPVDYRRTAIKTRSSADFILTHALNSIKDCSPFFIAVFGEQYGQHKSLTDLPLSSDTDNSKQVWSSLSHMDRNLLTAGRHGYTWVMESKWQYRSMLELEVQAAALRGYSNTKKCFFYVRDSKSLYLKGNDRPFDLKTKQKVENWRNLSSTFSDGRLSEADTEYAEKMLRELKVQIVRKGWSIRYFTSPLELGMLMLQEWTAVVNLLYPNPCADNEFTKASRCNDSYRRKLEAKYYANEDLKRLTTLLHQHVNQTMLPGDDRNFDRTCMAVEQAFQCSFEPHANKERSRPHSPWQCKSFKFEENVLTIVGDPGSGKSSLIATWLQQYELFHPECLIISEFIGSSYLSRDIGSFLRRCIMTIREKCRTSTSFSKLLDDTNDYHSLVSAFHASIVQVPCVLVMDGLNDLKASMGQDVGSIKRLSWLPPSIPLTCKIIFATRRSDLTYKALTSRTDVAIKWMPVFPKVDRIFLLKNRLEYQLLSVGTANSEKLTGNRLSEKPLFLATIANLISSCTNQRELDRVFEKCTELRTFRDFWKTVFSIWSLRYSWKKGGQGQPGSCRTIRTGWIIDSLRVLAVSRNGLLESEILQILFLLGYRGRSLVTPYDWMIFQIAAKDALTVQPDGCVMLSHTEIRHAIKFYLLGMPLPSATASATTLGSVNMLQHYHCLLASYFLTYGSMERKLIELPWQLEQGCDYVMLSQVLSKPRFFALFCREVENHPHLGIDLSRFWEKLNYAGFNPTHYLQTMIERSSGRTKGTFFPESQHDFQTVSSKVGMNSLKTFSTTGSFSIKRPSSTASSCHDLHHRQSTIGSRSEAGDSEVISDVGLNYFFLTENEPKNYAFEWNPRDFSPENVLDESLVDDDESCQLSYEVCMFLQRLGGNFLQDCKDGLLALSQLLLEMRPLSYCQQFVLAKTHYNLANLSRQGDNGNFIQCLCEEALEILDSLIFNMTTPMSPFQESVLETKELTCCLLAEVCLENHDLERVESLLQQASSCLKSYHSTKESSNLNFCFAKLHLAQESYGSAEASLKEVLAERLRCYGPSHPSVAHAFCEIADLYFVLESRKLSDQRISLLAYRQAFSICKQNSDKSSEAALLHKIGTLLKEDYSLFSTQEARQCLENAVDLYITQISPYHDDIPLLREKVKKISFDLWKGQYDFGHGKQIRKRTDQFASDVTWHDHLLREVSNVRGIRSAQLPVCDLGYFSPEQGRGPLNSKCGNAPRCFIKSDKPRDEIVKSVVHSTKDTPIVTGRKSHMSVRLKAADDNERLGFKRVPGFRQPEESSEVASDCSNTTFTKLSRPKFSYDIKKNCRRLASGQDRLCLTVHGSHSTLESMLDPLPSPRSSVKDSGAQHRSAWYIVPGRYKIPGKVLPSKYSQIQNERPPPSSRSCRSYITV